MVIFSTIGLNQHLTIFRVERWQKWSMFMKQKCTYRGCWMKFMQARKSSSPREGRPYTRLLPLEGKASGRQPGRLKGALEDFFFDPLPESEIHVWENE